MLLPLLKANPKYFFADIRFHMKMMMSICTLCALFNAKKEFTSLMGERRALLIMDRVPIF